MKIMVLTNTLGQGEDVLPGLGLLRRDVTPALARDASFERIQSDHILLVDAREETPARRRLCVRLRECGFANPIVVVLTEGGMPVFDESWQADEVLASSASPAEVAARLRICESMSKYHRHKPSRDRLLVKGDLVIDTVARTVELAGRKLVLRRIEYALLHYLAEESDRPVSRAELLHQVWGRTDIAGTRRIDTHITKLRSKLRPHPEQMIITVFGFGYQFVENSREPRAVRLPVAQPQERAPDLEGQGSTNPSDRHWRPVSVAHADDRHVQA